ncbi:hypothetical protein RirG_117950 [Rhizophagus irregularis DAOM 197198w]|uniref:Uncharacterized protein n=2 Tax=Rhizophagus irregularis TaxID=588596 RepID=A0A015KHP0_RHIIW|nr:hypothetical protein RirG_117950 [Rhizophagus irregularis DAOM 197198w]
MFQLYLGYKFYNGKWKIYERENVVRIWPRPSPQRNGLQWNEFCQNEFKDILGPSVDKLEDKCDDNEGQQEADESRDDTRLDWMVLAEMGPNAIIDGSSDLGLRDVDRNNDWFGSVRHRYSNIDSIDLNTFVQQSRIEDDVSTVNSIIVDYQTLNEKK